MTNIHEQPWRQAWRIAVRNKIAGTVFQKEQRGPRRRELIGGTVYKSSGSWAGTADDSWVICLRQSGAGANSSPPKWSAGTWRKKYAPAPRAPKENNQERKESGIGSRVTDEECKQRRLPPVRPASCALLP